MRQLDAIKLLPNWVKTLYTKLVEDDSKPSQKSGSKGKSAAHANAAKFQVMIQKIDEKCNKIDTRSLHNAQVFNHLKEFIRTIPPILDNNLKTLSEKIRLMVWINDTYHL